MALRRKYIKRAGKPVVAVRLDFDTEGFTYHKWDAEQRCKPGDWIVDNDGDVYTVDAGTFAATYTALSLGLYVKTAPVWAEQATGDGVIETKEGSTAYKKGDFLVFNTEGGGDGYAVSKSSFEAMYEPTGGEHDEGDDRS